MQPTRAQNRSIGELKPADGHALSQQADADYRCAGDFLRLIQANRSPNTFRAYRREIARFLLWSSQVLEKPIPALTPGDTVSYQQFLQDPPADWTGDRGSALFEASGRTPQSIGYAFSLLRQFFRYAVQTGHSPANPLDGPAVMRQQKPRSQGDVKYFDDAQWAALWDELDAGTQAGGRLAARTRWTIALGYFLGLRIHEIPRHGFDSFVLRDKWLFVLTGKGGKQAVLPVHEALLEEMDRYRRVWRLGRSLLGDQRPLAQPRSGKGRLTERRIAQCCKQLFDRAAVRLEADGSPEGKHRAALMRQATFHWLRHTYTTHITRAGLPDTVNARLTRHSNVQTLAIYTHAEGSAQDTALAMLHRGNSG